MADQGRKGRFASKSEGERASLVTEFRAFVAASQKRNEQHAPQRKNDTRGREKPLAVQEAAPAPAAKGAQPAAPIRAYIIV